MTSNRSLLKNGLRVITIPMASFESATVMVLVGAGSRYERKDNNGISHFLEHMAFKGTKSRPSAMVISSLIDGIGGEFNAFTGKETTGYYVKSSNQHVDLTLDLLSDMLQNSLLDSKEIEKEKGVIIEEINMYEDTPMRNLGDVYERLLYGDTPMGWDTAGTKEVIHSVNRDFFTTYMKSLYSADNMTVVVAGGIHEEKTHAMIDKHFGKMPKFDTLRANKVLEKQSKPGVFIKSKKTEQVHIALGFRTISLEHPDRYPLDILASILGGGMSSRLFHEVREKRGLAYYVRTNSDNYTDVGTLVSSAGIDPARIDEAVEVMVDQYRLIAQDKKGLITREELKKAKEYLKGHFVLELEDSRAVASLYAHQEILEKKLENPEETIQKIDAITLEQVQTVATQYITDKTMNLAIIGNFDDTERFQKLLKL